LYKGLYAFIALIQNIGRLEVFFMKPFLITFAGRRVNNSTLVFYAKKKIYRSLFVSIWGEKK
jgi:hypothetical protein